MRRMDATVEHDSIALVSKKEARSAYLLPSSKGPNGHFIRRPFHQSGILTMFSLHIEKLGGQKSVTVVGVSQSYILRKAGISSAGRQRTLGQCNHPETRVVGTDGLQFIMKVRVVTSTE
jgi:hypothetical protein